MSTKMVHIIAQALILVLLVEESSCIDTDGPQQRPLTIQGHVDVVPKEKKAKSHNVLFDPTVYARCTSFMVQFRRHVQKIKKHRKSGLNSDDDGHMGQSNMAQTDEKMSKNKRTLYRSVYVQCERYIRQFKKAEPISSSNRPPSNPSLNQWPERNKQRPRYSFFRRMQQRMVQMIGPPDLHISDPKETTIQKLLHFAKKNVLAIPLLLFCLYLVFDVLWLNSHWCCIIPKFVRIKRTCITRKPRQPAAIPLLPVVKSSQDENESKVGLPFYKENALVPNGPKDHQKRKEVAAHLPVPFANYERSDTLTSAERTPVREKTESKDVKESSLRNIPGFDSPKKSGYKGTNFFETAHKGYTPTCVDYYSQDADHEMCAKSEPVESWASTTPELDLDLLPDQLSVSEFDTLV